MGALFIELIHRLGYTRYLVQGGDWGSVIASMIALDDEQHVVRSSYHMHRDWAHSCHICTRTKLTPARSVPRLSSPVPHVHWDWAPPVTKQRAMGASRGTCCEYVSTALCRCRWACT